MTTETPTSGTAVETPDLEAEIIDVQAREAESASTIPDDEVRQKFMELIEAIERKAKAEATSVYDWRVQAVEKAKETIEQTEKFAKDQQTQLEESVKSIQDQAFERWSNLTQEAEDFTNRLQKAANEAWKIIMKEGDRATSTSETAANAPAEITIDDDSDDSQAA